MQIARGGPRPEAGTLTQLFFNAIEKFDKPDALQVKVGGRYEPISHRVVEERVRDAARGLQEIGVQQGDRVAILSENRPEWVIADMACLTSAITNVAVYTTLPAHQIEYILQDSGAVAIFVSTAAQAAKIAEIRASLPKLVTVISFDEISENVDFTLRELERRGHSASTDEWKKHYKERALSVKPDDLATLLYTSGTTGDPKGVMLTHDNIYSNVAAAKTLVEFTGHDTALSFLPLSHIFERMAGYYLMWATGTSIAYAEAIETVAANLIEVRPTLIAANPRLYEKVYARVLESARSGGGIKFKIFLWARSVAERWADIVLAGGTPSGLLAAQYRLADKLVYGKIKERTGGRFRYSVSGGAPLAPEINKFFFAIGFVILEGYGLTETSPVISVNTPDAFRIGTVGKPIAGVEVAIAPDGEILTRGPHVMKGYFNKPEATAEAIDADGWFHTGDIGVLKDGFLSITDRKKDIIVTAGGKNIAPQPLELRIGQNKYVSQTVLIGDKRRFPAAIIVPDFEQLEKWAKFKNISYTNPAQLITLPEVKAKMDREVLEPLADLAQYERPKKVLLIEHEFSIDNGMLTPSLKVKRRAVDEHYKAEIDAMYDAAEIEHHSK